MANANSWSANQTFALSSTTYGSFTTASTTNFTIGGSTFTSLLGTGLTNPSGALTLDATYLNTTANAYIAASTTIPKTYTANTFTALQQFNANASTTQLSVYNNVYLGATATSTFTSAGYLGVGTTTPQYLLTVSSSTAPQL